MTIKKAIPSVLTSANLLCGFLVFLVDPKYGVVLILIGAIFDVFDGAVARMLDAQSEFGKQLDSLADLVTFGVAPAYLLSLMLSEPWHYFTALIVIAAALRLAKFNISGGDTYYFKGLPTPASALFLIGIIVAKEWFLGDKSFILIPLILLIASLNVSNVKMFSFKGLKKDKLTLPFLITTGLVAAIVAFFNYKLSIIIASAVYLILSIIYTLSISETKKA